MIRAAARRPAVAWVAVMAAAAAVALAVVN